MEITLVWQSPVTTSLFRLELNGHCNAAIEVAWFSAGAKRYRLTREHYVSMGPCQITRLRISTGFPEVRVMRVIG
jgi:hypothetical protein